MSLTNLTDRELFEKIRFLAREERRITSEVIHGIQEIARRRLYAKYGYDSLFTFLMKELGYDEGSASRRMNAVRVIQSVPEVEEALESGKLTIATVAQAQTFFQREKKRSEPCSVEKKREILRKLEGCSKLEAERVLAIEFPGHAKPDQVRMINEAQSEIRFTADQELMKMLKQIQDLTPHRNLESGYNALFKFMAAQVLEKLDPAKQKPRQKLIQKPKSQCQNALTPGEVAAQQTTSRYIPAAIKREVWKRDRGRCTYVSPISGKRCESSHGLQLDHRIPLAKGGETSISNLRLLCGPHNRLEAILHFGERKMMPFLNGAGSTPRDFQTDP